MTCDRTACSNASCAATHTRERVNPQTEKGQAKRYQVRQVATLVRRYDLRLEDKR